ncbi:retrovirus-related pol polyprotein from transposon TNT 1-94 [Tanacetum coccineum]
MVADLRYFNSLEHEVDSLKSQLETQRTQFLNKIDRLSREYYYPNHMNAKLGIYTTLDEFTDLQCDYVDQVVKCERLEKELSKRTENVNNKSFNELSKRFSELEQHSINLELALQQSQEQIKNDKASKQQESNSFRELNVKYFEIQDLKAQLQDKDIAISKLTTFSDSLAKKDFSKSKSVAINNVSNDLSNPVTTQILPQNVKSILKNTNVIAPGMYKVHTKPNQTRTPQLPQDIRKTNKRMSFSTRVIPTTIVSRPQLKSNQLEDRVMPNYSQGKKQQVEDHHRNFKFSNNKRLTKQPIAVPISTREPKRTMNQSVATPLMRTVAAESTNQKPRSTIRKQYEQISKTCKWWYSKITPPGYKWKPKTSKVNVNPNVSMPLGTKSRTTNISEPMTLRKSTVSNTPLSSNSFVARRDNSIHSGCSKHITGNLKLLSSRGTNLYSITLQYTSTPNPICLMAKASSSQAWLWHRRLLHLNLDTINLLSKYDIVTGLPKLKFVKDHLCSSCELGKAKCKSFKTKTTPSSKRRLQILHMDLCGPMRVESFNGKKYVLVIVDDYSRYTWTHFLGSKDETPEVLIDFLKLVQRGLHAQVRTV